MWNRLLLALDQYESGASALHLTESIAGGCGSEVRVLHVRELSPFTRALPLETLRDAERLVDEAVLRLRVAGAGAEGRVCSAREDFVARRIADEADAWRCDAIVLGSRRLRRLGRLSGRGVRERLLRTTRLPLLTAPPAPVDVPKGLIVLDVTAPGGLGPGREH